MIIFDKKNLWLTWDYESPGGITLFTSGYYDDYSVCKYSTEQFKGVAAHEFGHALGLSDAYKSWDRIAPAPLDIVPANDIMRNNEKVSNVDIKMVLDVQRFNVKQHFPVDFNYGPIG